MILKNPKILLLVISSLIFSACGKDKNPDRIELDAINDCYWPDTGEEEIDAPKWVCSSYDIKGFALTSTASYKKTKAGYNFSKTQATALAKANASRQVSTALNSTIDIQSSNEEVISQNSTTSISESIISGAQVLRHTTHPITKDVWVLVGIPISQAKFSIKTAYSSSFNALKKSGKATPEGDINKLSEDFASLFIEQLK